MRRGLVSLGCLLAGLASWPVWAAEPLYRERFDADAGGWVNAAKDAVQPTSQTAVAHAGGALESKYSFAPKTAPHVLVLAKAPPLTGARAFRFWLRTSHDTMLALALQERGGGRYIAVFSSEAGRWQHPEISPDRMRLADDTTDDDNKLDLDQVEGLALIDLSSVFPLVQSTPGPRTLWLDDFQVDADEAPTAYSAKHSLPYLLDDFQADYLPWLAPVGTLQRDRHGDEGELVWQYGGQQPAGTFTALISMLGPLPAEGAGRLVFTLSSELSRNYLVALQEENRATRPERSFHNVIQVQGGGQRETIVLPLSKFQLEEKDKPKGTGPLRLDLVNRLILADLDVMAGKAVVDNTLRLNEILLTE